MTSTKTSHSSSQSVTPPHHHPCVTLCDGNAFTHTALTDVQMSRQKYSVSYHHHHHHQYTQPPSAPEQRQRDLNWCLICTAKRDDATRYSPPRLAQFSPPSLPALVSLVSEDL
ncbi:hypothetical protein E2C01_060184 [Portunus trituberculatus]|uniref:Uncharacterized protein n=1 Tax=Portunus trituberculatus TaxID=210409 RepID=A0A5B7H0A9_PORTR|nr:hypothetical protein [Portunus trituberculatus]